MCVDTLNLSPVTMRSAATIRRRSRSLARARA
jgi:hypothetical protein